MLSQTRQGRPPRFANEQARCLGTCTRITEFIICTLSCKLRVTSPRCARTLTMRGRISIAALGDLCKSLSIYGDKTMIDKFLCEYTMGTTSRDVVSRRSKSLCASYRISDAPRTVSSPGCLVVTTTKATPRTFARGPRRRA
jgi:hypothetical protein